MGLATGYVGLVLIGVWLSTSQKSDAVSVKPALCPTNKIAPHRRIANWDNRPRTFGHISGLFNGNDLQYDSPSSLLEDPQEDDPEDCGDIEDYDEHDLSSITSTGQRRGSSGYVENRLFFGHNNYDRPPYRPPQNGNPTRPQYPNRPTRPPQNGGYLPTRPTRPPQQYPTRPPYYENSNRPTGPPQYPTRPPRPYPPTRPPYSSGGFFSGNEYRPPYQQKPSDSVKPVYEGAYEQSSTYRPGVVGGPSGHVVGVPVRPTRPQYDEDQTTTSSYPVYDRPQQSQDYPIRRERPRRLNNESVIGSFFGLLFK